MNILSKPSLDLRTYLACAGSRVWNNDVETRCARCQARIFHRANAPVRLAKLCVDCALVAATMERLRAVMN